LIIPADYAAPPVQILTDTKVTTDLFEFVILNHTKVFKPFLQEAEARMKEKKEKVKQKRKQTVSENADSAAQVTRERANSSGKCFCSRALIDLLTMLFQLDPPLHQEETRHRNLLEVQVSQESFLEPIGNRTRRPLTN